MKKKLGLALGSGGACGLSHVGALRALEEYGITPDYITGTSMGAIVGALYSAGLTLDEIEEKALKLKMFSIIDFEPLFFLQGGVIKGKKAENIFKSFLGDKTFEDLNIPFSTLAVNLNTAEKKVFSTGNIVNALRATSAIPCLFTPFEIDGDLYVDGGLLERVPCDLVKDMGADVVVGIDVIGDFSTSKKPSGLIEYFYRTFAIIDDAYTNIKPNCADIYIKICQEEVNPFLIKNLDKAIVYGYEAVINKIDDIIKLIEK